MEIGHLVNSGEEEIEPVNQKGKENNDDLDLALDALRDCDTDFIKFDQVSVNAVKELNMVLISLNCRKMEALSIIEFNNHQNH